MKRFPKVLTAIVALWISGSLAEAQTSQSRIASDYPAQLVRIVVPFSAGSQSDILARAYAEKLQQRWKRDVIVENRPGLAGTASVAKAANDGYTFLAISNGHTIIGALNASLTFDPVKDFTPVAHMATAPGIVVVSPEAGPKSVAELVAMARSKPAALNYASAGLGSASSIAVELLKSVAQLDIVHVPYRGLPDAHTSIMRNDALLFVTFFSAGGDLIQAGRLRPIAVTTAKRLAVLPDVPTMQEAGVQGYAFEPWFGLLAPANTDPQILEIVNLAISEISRSPDLQQTFGKLGVDLISSSREDFGRLLRQDTERFSTLFKNAK
jgi:tripartite-type tricarboxylate transporter receptor subunit TctC